ncbi:hypothetical protein [Mucilaginibacter endophyticus]|uniref:hypothetical protein n=1 Tax=Mucilaginibacter endophyticus TaxID=2675003 RepID=UPI0012B173E9|nr:hypothetical protein [Mucilaginibacter endophyticus]
MKLYTWSGFPTDKETKGFALANNVEEARALIINSFSNSDHYNFIREFIYNHEPHIYTEPTGWIQEIGPQFI